MASAGCTCLQWPGSTGHVTLTLCSHADALTACSAVSCFVLFHWLPVAKKPTKPEGEPEVPVIPSRLAVHKKRPWWAQAARVVVGTAAMAVAGAAGAAAAKHHQVRIAGQKRCTLGDVCSCAVLIHATSMSAINVGCTNVGLHI